MLLRRCGAERATLLPRSFQTASATRETLGSSLLVAADADARGAQTAESSVKVVLNNTSGGFE